MTGFWVAALEFFALLFCMFLACRWAFRAGREKEKGAHEQGKNARIETALRHRDRLRRDADYARRLRARFTRK